VTWAVTLIIAAVIGYQGAIGSPPLKADGPTVKIGTAEEALSSVRKAFGASELAELPMTARRETLTEDETPFLKDEIIGHELWIVDIPKWSVRNRSLRKVKDSYSRKLTICLMPETGVIVKIKSDWPRSVPTMAPMVSAEVAEMQLRRTGETYHGFPEYAPRVTFEMALDAIAEAGYGTTDAKQIVADYLIWSSMDFPHRRVWAVTLRGLDVYRPSPRTPPGRMDQYRHVIDADTGEWLFMTNNPRPDYGATTNE